jgi:peptidyl-prolyl cis-trans isomerase SurA
MRSPVNKLLYILILLSGLPPFGGRLLAQQTVIDRIVAVVGKEYILLSDLNAQTEFFAFNNRMDPTTPGLKEQVLEGMVNEKLVLAEALQDTLLSVSDEEVGTQLDALIAQRIALPQIGSEKRLEEMYGMTISKMKRDFRDDMRKQLLVQKLQQTRFGSVQTSRREIEEFFATFKDSLPAVPEELQLYHILRIPKIGQQSKAKVKEKAQVILDSIKAGGDFAELARRYSEDRGTATDGGDLGSWHRGQFVKEFEEIVFSLTENQLSDIVETSRGFHIIQLLERRGELVHARHILLQIGVDSSGVDEAKSFLESLKDSVKNGMDFSDLARKYSEDKESGPMGGFLGKYTIDQFDESLLRAVSSLKPGEISDPVEVATGSTTGFHIIYLKQRIPEHAMNLEEDWKRIEQLASGYKRNNEYQQWLKKLRGEIYWTIRL